MCIRDREMTVVAPVCINMPDKTPAVRIRNTAGVTSFTPSVITVTVSFKDSPVSYTHLDVYKRQGLEKTERSTF